jgi:hypothetical protein
MLHYIYVNSKFPRPFLFLSLFFCLHFITYSQVVTQDTIIPENETQPQIVCKTAQLTFIYPLGTGFVKSKEKCYHFSINILGGITGYVKGFEAGGLFNINKYEVKGVQLAGLFNIGKSVTFQAAGIYNVAKETKCQLAGIINIAQESRVQIGGILNITKKGGFQMGLINVRDTADGVSLGLINIVKHGGILEAGIEAGEFVHTAATFRSGIPRLYSILSVGYNFKQHFWVTGNGWGTSFKLVGNLGLSLELTRTALYGNNISILEVIGFWRNSLFQFKPILHYRFAKHFKMYAGPSLNLLLLDTRDGWLSSPLEVKIPYKMYHRTFKNNTLDMWVGVVGGLKF